MNGWTFWSPESSVGGRARGRGRDDLGKQRLVLELIEDSKCWIAARACHRLSRCGFFLFELALTLLSESRAVEAALTSRRWPLSSPDLVFGHPGLEVSVKWGWRWSTPAEMLRVVVDGPFSRAEILAMCQRLELAVWDSSTGRR